MGAVYDRSLLFEDLLKFADVLFQFSGRYAFFHTEAAAAPAACPVTIV